MSNTLSANFAKELKKQIGIWYEIKWGKRLSQITRRSSFIFKEKHVLIDEEDNPSDKLVMVEEELDGIDNFKCGNFKMSIVESLLERITERISKMFYKPILWQMLQMSSILIKPCGIESISFSKQSINPVRNM